MAIKLIVKSLDMVSEPQEYLLEEMLISVGRSNGCSVELDHNEVSRRHFIIKYENDNYSLIDEGSSHGTWLNDMRLEPEKEYILNGTQTIHLPGFVIDVINDHEPPRPEKTTVMARKLIGKLFEDISMNEEMPFLYDCARQQSFFFQQESTSFILGRAHHVDFLVADEHINKEHLSFIRDINGISAVVVNDASLKVNDEEIKDVIILRHGDVLELGETHLVFFEREDQALKDAVHNRYSLNPEYQENEPNIEEVKTIPQRRPVITYLDYLFSLLFVVAMGSSVWFILKMIRH